MTSIIKKTVPLAMILLLAGSSVAIAGNEKTPESKIKAPSRNLKKRKKTKNIYPSRTVKKSGPSGLLTDDGTVVLNKKVRKKRGASNLKPTKKGLVTADGTLVLSGKKEKKLRDLKSEGKRKGTGRDVGVVKSDVHPLKKD